MGEIGLESAALLIGRLPNDYENNINLRNSFTTKTYLMNENIKKKNLFLQF